MKKIKCLLALFLTFQLSICTAQDYEWNLQVLQKGQSFYSKKYDYMYSNTGFYIYKNCYYDFIMDDGDYTGRLMNITPDTILFTRCSNHYTQEKWDTLIVPTNHIKKIAIPGRRSIIGNYIRLKNYSLVYERGSVPSKRFESKWLQIYRNDSSYYEIVKSMASYMPIDFYEMDDGLYYFEGIEHEKKEPYPISADYNTKKYIWFTPCDVEKINGVALGFSPENIKYDYISQAKDSLEINGLSIAMGDMDLIGNLLLLPFKPTPYQVSYERVRKQRDLVIKGMNVSLLGIVNEANIHGINLSGINTIVYELHGCSVSAFTSSNYICKGISISAISNTSHCLTGVQIGLFNKSKRTKGIQIGLWNVNEKRKMPFINWNFRDCEQKL